MLTSTGMPDSATCNQKTCKTYNTLDGVLESEGVVAIPFQNLFQNTYMSNFN